MARRAAMSGLRANEDMLLVPRRHLNNDEWVPATATVPWGPQVRARRQLGAAMVPRRSGHGRQSIIAVRL